MIAEFFAFLEDAMIVLLILVGMVLLLFGFRHIMSRGISSDCDDSHNASFRREIDSSDNVLGPHNLFRRFFDMDIENTHTPSIPKFYRRDMDFEADNKDYRDSDLISEKSVVTHRVGKNS